MMAPPDHTKNKQQEDDESDKNHEDDDSPGADASSSHNKNEVLPTTQSAERGRSAVQLPFLFPSKLYDMLRDCCVDGSVVSWLPDGKAFKVHKVEVFSETILPTYFNQSKYKSFLRQRK
jgi:hypothetical protein